MTSPFARSSTAFGRNDSGCHTKCRTGVLAELREVAKCIEELSITLPYGTLILTRRRITIRAPVLGLVSNG